MVTKDIIQADLKTALKNREERRVSTLRLLLAAIKNREIELMKPLDETGIVAVISTGVKQRRESIEEYTKGGRPDLVDQEQEEMNILQVYLPVPLSDGELSALVDEAVRETGATGAKDMGLIMKWIMPKVAGRADGKAINQMVKARFS